jgi:dihydrofolate synthase/folylpolyglutamate synthase
MAKSKALALINDLLKIHPKGFDLSLGRIRNLLEKLDNPQDKLPPVIHVAGTNGKGSTIAFCRAILEADGKSVHVDTSPHLVNYHERYRLGAKGGGEIVSDDVLAEALTRVTNANAGTPITVFELLSAVMFVLFSEHPADVALIEVGLGGRADVTNVISKPQVSVIAPISLDHQNFLGDTLEKIAFEKAGIIKENVPVVIAEQNDAARGVLEDVAFHLNVSIAVGGQDFSCYEEHGRMVYQDENGLLDLPLPKLVGKHQLTNAATAIAALRYGGFDISVTAIEKGMKTVSWPGRLQQMKQGVLVERLPKGSELWIDGGHNPDAGVVISAFMKKLQGDDPRKLVLISAMLTTKDPSGYFKEFTGLADQVFTVPVASSDAGFGSEELAEMAKRAGLAVRPLNSLDEAIDQIAREWVDEPAPRVLICGTLYLAGEALDKNKTPPK